MLFKRVIGEKLTGSAKTAPESISRQGAGKYFVLSPIFK
jgi:hypothetical protein